MSSWMKVLASALLLVGLVACGPGESEITPQDSSMQEEEARVGASTGSETLQRCVDTHDPGVDYFPDKVEALHAQAWDVLYEDNYKIVTTYTSVASQHAGTGVRGPNHEPMSWSNAAPPSQPLTETWPMRR